MRCASTGDEAIVIEATNVAIVMLDTRPYQPRRLQEAHNIRAQEKSLCVTMAKTASGTSEASAGSSIPGAEVECTPSLKSPRAEGGPRSHIDRGHRATACVTTVKDATENPLAFSGTPLLRFFSSRGRK